MTKAYIIHLERATARRLRVEALRASLDMDTEIVPAVDGAALSSKEVDRVYKRHLFNPRYPFMLRAGEIGCFLSHRACWERIVASSDPGAFVFEDDVELDETKITGILSCVEQISGPNRYLRLPIPGKCDKGNVVWTDESTTIVRPLTPGTGTLGQYVGREAAGRLLDLTRRFDRPIDVYLQARFHHLIDVLAVAPPMLGEVSATIGDSLIHRRKRGVMDVLHREIARPLYRMRVNRLNKRSECAGAELGGSDAKL